MHQKAPRLKCTKKPPEMYQKIPRGGGFWYILGVVRGVFWYILGCFLVFDGVFLYILGGFLVQNGGFFGTF